MGKTPNAGAPRKSIKSGNIDPKKHALVACATCKTKGFVTHPDRRNCPECGGFGWIIERTLDMKKSDWEVK